LGDSAVSIGFVGIGNMGWPMAAKIAKSGLPLKVFDLSGDRVRTFASECGATAATSLADVGDGVEVVVTMLPTGADVRNVLLGEGRLADHLAKGTVIVDMSSSEPVGTRDLGPELAAKGLMLIDAPVSGGVPGAEAGTLTIMIGGEDEAAIEKATPALEAMGKNLFRTGPLGSGHAMKALNNYVAAAGFTAAAEAMLVGENFGLDPAKMIDIINVSTGRNFNTEIPIKEHVLTETFGTGFQLGLMTKDVRIAADLAEEMGVESPMSALARSLWAAANEAEGADQDFTAAYRHWKKDRSNG